MPNWRDQLPLLEKLCTYPRIGLITDMDGTISPIVPVPADAQPTDRNRDLLDRLHQRLALVAVVSGRAVDDVRQRVNLPQLTYAGNHGLERWQDNQVVLAPQAKPYRPNLERARDRINVIKPDGMWVEDKRATLSVHYRDTANPAKTVTEYTPHLEQIAQENDLRLFQGRMIFELRPPLDVDKGTIFKQLIDEYQLDSALYIGDDTTDADALRMAQTLRQNGTCYALAVGVQSDETPDVVTASSDVLVDGVSGVESFLSWLDSAVSAS
ncbi:MAG: trehalose-phosphatase [Anaerolineae bacterium]